ncbi:aminotransferase class V-fold PLP-dependent enzyme [Cupriavidus sp. 8B]
MNDYKSGYDGWLLYHSVGLFPGQRDAVQAALESFTSVWYRPDDARWEYGLQARQEVIDDWAKLIGAPSNAVFTAENVTEAFVKFIDALGQRRLAGRKVLIAADCFPSLHFLLTGLAPSLGFTLETVPLSHDKSYVTDDDYIASWDDSVALAVITWVTSTASKRADLKRLVAHGRKQGSLLAADMTQGMGLLPFNISETPLDFVVSTTLKWLCGTTGAGLAYINPAILEEGLFPVNRGWYSQPNPFNWDLDKFTFAPDARRFDIGTPSLLPFVASGPGLQWHLAGGSQDLRAQNLRVSHKIMEVLDRRGYALASPRSDDERGGSVMARLPDHISPRVLEENLFAAGVSVDTRGRVMRFSPGVVTNESVTSVLEDLLPN